VRLKYKLAIILDITNNEFIIYLNITTYIIITSKEIKVIESYSIQYNIFIVYILNIFYLANYNMRFNDNSNIFIIY